MPRGVRVKHPRKAGAWTTGELLEGEIGVNTSAKRLEFSTDGSDVNVVSGGGSSFSGDPALIPYAAMIPKAPRAGAPYDQGATADTQGTNAVTAGTVRGVLVVTPFNFRVSGLRLALTTAASSGTDEAYFSIYTADSGGFWPGSRVYLSSAVSGWTSANTAKGPDLDFTFSAFTAYWAFVHFGSNPTVRTLGNAGAFPLGLENLAGNTQYKSMQFSRAIGTPMPATFDLSLATTLSTNNPVSFRMIPY